MKWAPIIILATLVVATSTTVLAECSWVLWIKEHSVMSKDENIAHVEESVTWELHSAVETRNECIRNQEALWKIVSNQGEEWAGLEKSEKRFPIGLFRQFKRGGFWNTTLHCFPDTVNPRRK